MERAAFADEPTWLHYRIERSRKIPSLDNDARTSDAIDELIAEAEIRLKYLARWTEKSKPIPESQRDPDVTDEDISRCGRSLKEAKTGGIAPAAAKFRFL